MTRNCLPRSRHASGRSAGSSRVSAGDGGSRPVNEYGRKRGSIRSGSKAGRVQVLGDRTVGEDQGVIGHVEVLARAVAEVRAHDRDPAAGSDRRVHPLEERRHRLLRGAGARGSSTRTRRRSAPRAARPRTTSETIARTPGAYVPSAYATLIDRPALRRRNRVDELAPPGRGIEHRLAGGPAARGCTARSLARQPCARSDRRRGSGIRRGAGSSWRARRVGDRHPNACARRWSGRIRHDQQLRPMWFTARRCRLRSSRALEA